MTGAPCKRAGATPGATGYYRMYRGWMESPMFRDEPFTEREAWMWLIENAAFKPFRKRIKQHVFDVSRGQVVASLRFMAEAWQWTESHVRRFLNRLKTDAAILCVADAGINRVTVCNYERYQADECVSDAESDTVADAAATQPRRKLEVSKEEEERVSDSSSDSRDVGASADVARRDPLLPGVPVPVPTKGPSRREGVNKACEIWNATAAAAGLPAVKLPLAAERMTRLHAALCQMGDTPEAKLETWTRCCKLAAQSSYMARDRRGIDFMYRNGHWQQMLEGQFIEDFADVPRGRPAFGVVHGGRQPARKLAVPTIMPRRALEQEAKP